jgi:5-methylcytosine-specific restriction endonuclease McrA
MEDEIHYRSHIKLQRSLMTDKLRDFIKKRDNYTCQICGDSIYKNPHIEFHIDHIIPVSKGGITEENNLQTLCASCNLHKSNKI